MTEFKHVFDFLGHPDRHPDRCRVDVGDPSAAVGRM